MTSPARNGAAPRLIAFVLFVVSFAYFSAFLHYGVNLDDEGALLYKFERMADGQRAYVDYHLGYTPGVFYVHSTLQRLFDESITPGRIALALTNSASTALLALLIAPFAGPTASLVVGLCYLALLPVNPGAFASFNVPYPTWYSIFLYLAGLLVCRNYVAAPTPRRAFLAGVLAGLGFLFKPNIGAVQLACATLLVLSALNWKRSAATPAGTAWWWTVCAAALVGVWGIFGFAPRADEVWTYLAPVLVCALFCARRAARRDVPESMSSIALDTTAVMVGFVAINLPWIAYHAARVPADLLLREVLFVGSGYTQFFYSRHPPVFLATLALTFAGFAFAVVPSRLLSRARRPALLLVVAAVAVIAAAGVLLARRPMVEGFAASVTTAFESYWVYPVTLAIHWLALLACWGGRAEAAPDARTGAPRSPSADAFFVTTVGSVFFYLQTYPRTDIMHWATAASLPVGLAFGLAGIGAGCWARREKSALRAAVFALCIAPLVFVCALRLGGSLSTVLRWNGGWLELRPTVGLQAKRAPVWMNIGQAERYRDIDRLVELLDRVSEPDDAVLMFPAIDLLSFLSNRHSPIRDTYFFPGWLGHDEEARALTALEANPPPFAVVQHEHRAFFDAAALYYYQLTDYLEREYEKLAQVGRFALLVRRGHAVDESLVEETAWMSGDDRLHAHIERSLAGVTGKDRVRALDELSGDWIEGYYPSLVSSLGDGDLEVRDAAARALRNAANDRVGLALLEAARDGRLTEPARTLALRRGIVWTGRDSVAPLIEIAADENPRLRDAAATGLAHAAKRGVLREFWPFAPSVAMLGSSLDDAGRERVRSWLFHPESDPRLEYFAAAEVVEIGAVADIARMTRARTPNTPCTQKKGGMNHCGIFLFDVLSQTVRRPATRARILYEIEARTTGAVPGAAELALDELRTDEPLAPRAVIAALEHDPAADELVAERLLAREPPRYIRELLHVASVAGRCETVAAAEKLAAQGSDAEIAAAAGRVLAERARLCSAPAP